MALHIHIGLTNHRKPVTFYDIIAANRHIRGFTCKMESILDICYNESLFNLSTITRARTILTKNCTKLDPILETDRVTRDEIVALCCCSTHKVKQKTIFVKEDDAMYNIFAIYAGQLPKFMRSWLKLYTYMYTKQFKHVGENYLKSKGLEFDHWRESIKDSCKGDVMCLLGLNYAMDTHTIVHLHGN